tara:strand:+ start:1380 stop:3008 length:1629 start_codon:yes stop_codon:yes gene_type:complete
MAKIISINGKKVSPDDEEEIDSITLDPIVVSPNSKEKIKPKSLKIISTKKVPVAPRKEIEVAPERSFVEATGRKLSSLARGATPALVGGGIGLSLAGPPGALVGSMALPAAEGVSVLLNKLGLDVGSPTELVQSGLTNLGFPVPETIGERSFETAGTFVGMGGPQIRALEKLAKTATTPFKRGLATQLSQSPIRQMASTIPAGLASQFTYEKTESPALSMIAGVAGGLPAFIKSPKIEQVSKDSLQKIVTQSYSLADKNGFNIDPTKFQDSMKVIATNLREKGFAEGRKQFPKLDTAVAEIKKLRINKKTKKVLSKIDYQEIKALRAIIKKAKSSTDKDESRLASELLDDFDDVLINIKPSDMVKGSSSKDLKNAMEYRKAGDQAFTKLKKGELFEDIAEKASRETAGNRARTITGELKKLANNPNRMKYFTKSEQKAIKQASETKGMKGVYSLLGNIVPTGSLRQMLALTGVALRPEIILPAIATGIGSQTRLNTLRDRDITKLIDLMRGGGKPNYATSPQNISNLRNITSSGLLNNEEDR